MILVKPSHEIVKRILGSGHESVVAPCPEAAHVQGGPSPDARSDDPDTGGVS